MNREAEKHLDKAVKFVAKGDGFYLAAAKEIIAAREADPMLSWPDIAEMMSKSAKWCQQLVRDVAILEAGSGVNWDRGSHGTKAEIQTGAKKLLAEAPMEQVEQMISSLPKERQQQIAAAADPKGYAAARVSENERVANQTPAQRREIEAAKEAISHPVRQAVASFATLGVVGHLEQATEDLSEMISEQTVTAESIYRITQAHERFITELEVARAMAGLEERSEA